MTTATQTFISDIGYAHYQVRQQLAIGSANIIEQADRIKCSDKFVFSNDRWISLPYQGFAVVSMVNAHPANKPLLKQLRMLSSYLDERLNTTETYFILPDSSYHQTIANTLSGERYFEKVVKANLAGQFPELVDEAFKSVTVEPRQVPIAMRPIGLNVFGSCIALLCIFDSEHDYNTITSFRSQFYSSKPMEKINVKWTRPFIGHITLAYLGRTLNAQERLMLSKTIIDLNASMPIRDLLFNISKAELRSYNDLSHFHAEPNYPIYPF